MEWKQIDIFADENKGATFSNCGQYRYDLWRIWDASKPMIMFIGLNPSTANKDSDDATINKVRKISKHNGFGGFFMLNCFAYIATKPEHLKHNQMSDEWNNNMITVTASKCKDVVFAWGNFRIIRELGRDVELREMFPNAKALHINKNGSPKHPLYCKDESKFISYINSKNKL